MNAGSEASVGLARMVTAVGLAAAGILVVPVAAGAGTIYYVDDTGGDDNRAGTHPDEAWQTLGKVSSIGYAPGDQILFKAGGRWTGELDLNGHGTESEPIRVDRYGDGDKPRIDGDGYESAVRLQDVSCWEVANLEIVNDGGATRSGDSAYRAGVLVKTTYGAVQRHIYLRHLTVHDIFPEVGPYGHGVHVVATGSASVDTYYDDVRIEHCHIYRTGRYGAWVQHKGSGQSNPGFQYNTNIYIRNNRFENTGGSGAETGWGYRVFVENNVIDHSGASVDPRQWARGSGYWPWKSRMVIVQSNEFRHARGGGDSCGVHIDYGCRDVVVQYNLSLDNEGGFVEILGDCENVTYRYNVSINDGSRVKGVGGAFQDGHLIWVSDYSGSSSRTGSTHSRIYNNTVYVRPGIDNVFKIMSQSEDTRIENNIFHIDGTTTYTDDGNNTRFDGNLWFGNIPTGVPFGPSDVFSDPLTANPGGTRDADYRVSAVSPAVAAGVRVAGRGHQDYWGNVLPAGAVAIGAHERTFSDAGVISVNLAPGSAPGQQIGNGEVYGIAARNCRVAGWINSQRSLGAAHLTLSDGFPSTVTLSGTAPGGWDAGNAAYAHTPLHGGISDYPGTAGPVSVTLANLAASFPRGYRVVAYLSGFSANRGASISNGATTYFYRTLDDPGNEFTGELSQATITADPGDGQAPFAQYAVFGDATRLTNDTVTLTLRTRYGGGAILGGFQVLAAGPHTVRGVPHGWYQGYGVPVADALDDDGDHAAAWQEYMAGTDPTDGTSVFKMLGLTPLGGGHLQLTWRGGVTGHPGPWCVSVSGDFVDWATPPAGIVARDPSGVQTWVHTNGMGHAANAVYRIGVEPVVPGDRQ